jgi:hypothetical protein
MYTDRGVPFQFRTADEFGEIAFGGLEMVEPGLVPVAEWRPDTALRPMAHEVAWNGGAGRKR